MQDVMLIYGSTRENSMSELERWVLLYGMIAIIYSVMWVIYKISIKVILWYRDIRCNHENIVLVGASDSILCTECCRFIPSKDYFKFNERQQRGIDAIHERINGYVQNATEDHKIKRTDITEAKLKGMLICKKVIDDLL